MLCCVSIWYKTGANIFGQWDNCNVNSSSSINQGQSITHEADGGATTADYYYYAIFATVQATQTPSFSTIAMGNTTTGTLSIKHAHANSVKIEITGEHASDFKINNTTSYSFSSTALGTQNITITFKPTCAGERKANLKITNENGLPELSIAIQANATILPQTIAWNDVYNQNMFVGSTLNVSATASTGHAVTYESSNPNVISVSGNTLTAKAIGEAVITATQYDGCTYQTVSTSLTFTVSDKKTPTFWLNGDPNQLTDNLKTEDTRTITITNVDERMTADYDPNLLSYTFNGSTATIKALDAGPATLTLTQPETSQIFFGERTFTFNITKYDTNTLTNDLATAYMVDDIISEADIYTINNNEVPVQIISGNESILKFENGQLKAVGAGTTILTVKQAETNKWVERTATKTITVHKYDITASINPDNAVWNQLVTPNPFSASTQHKFSGTTSAVTDFSVTQQNNEHIALMDATTRDIQTYYTNGQVNFLITRPEDYKYNALNQTLTLTVNQNNETCPLPISTTSVQTGTGDNSTSGTVTLNGAGDLLSFNYKLNSSANVSHYLTTQYSLSENGEDFQDIAGSQVGEEDTKLLFHSLTLPKGTKRIRFKRTDNGLGNKTFEISNITVTRAQYLRPTEGGHALNSTNALVLPTVAVGQPSSKQFHLEWSACTDIKITCDNPKFTINTTDITTRDGSIDITVSCNTSEVGTFTDNVVIYNQEQMETFPITCEVYTKWLTDSISGSATHSMKVDEPWNTDFYFPIQRASQYPTTDGAFHYAIKHTFVDENQADRNPNYPNEVISYNNGVITAHNAGTAILTIKHDETDEHFESQQFTCTLTVSKHDVERTWKDPVYFNDTIYNYFTTSNTDSLIIIESQTDTDVAKLTNEFHPTSNNSLDLITFNKEASTTVTVSQAETYYWNGYSEPHIITPIDPNNHVTFTIDSNNKMNNVFKYSTNNADDLTWDNGIRLGDDDWVLGSGGGDKDGGYDWSDKYIIIEFTGIPDTLYLTTDTDNAATTGTESDLFFYISEGYMPQGATTPTFTQTWEYTEQNNDVALKLNPNTRFVKLCYTGNLRGWFKGTNKYSGVTVTELNEFRAVDQNKDTQDITHLDFGANQVFINKTLSFKLRYANPGYKITVESTDPHFTVDPSYINDIGGEYHGTRNIDVTYTSTEPYATSDDAMIILTDEIGNRDSVFLSASSYKAEQVLHWRNDFEAIPQPIIRLKNGEITDAAWATSYLPVTFTSNTPNVIKISDDGKTLIPVAEGEAEITAYQLGNETWLPADPITKTFIVTEKLLQYIVWDDNLTNIIKEDINPQTLTLTAQVYLQQEDGTVVFSQEQTDNLQYQSSNNNIVSTNTNILTINNIGKTTLTATVEGNNDYAPASLTKTVIVRSATSGCEDNLLYHHEGDPIQFFQYNLNEIAKDPIALDRSAYEAGYLVVAHYGESWNLAIEYYNAEIQVQQSIDGGNNWETIQTIYPVKDQENIDTIPLRREATHIRFVRNSGGQGYQFLYNIHVHPAQYIEAQDVVDFGEIHVGSRETRTFPLHYSNIKHALTPVPSISEVTASPNSFGECNGVGTQEISVTWLPTQVDDNATATITFTDPNSGMTKVVTLRAKVTTGTQNIAWDNIPNIIQNCNNIQFPERTTANLPITWTVIEGEEYANFNEDGILEIYKNGTIVVEATQEGTANYQPLTPIQYTFEIKLDLIFVGTENNYWHNPNNWTMCRLPYHTETVTIQAPAVLSTHDTIAGITFASNGSLHITSTGGLTVGTQGITGATTDGSNILIDNTPDGAGFLLISPDAPADNKHPYFTMNFTTRAFNEGVPRDETWQYMGAPGDDAQFKSIDDRTLIYHWEETKGWMTQSHSLLSPIPTWQGYALTQSIQTNNTYQITAKAIQGSHTINLTSTPEGMKGDNLFVNSFTAPIDITKIDPTTDITGNWNYQTFYLFNTGSWNDWQGTNPTHKHDASSPGHYYTIPIRSAQYLDDDAQTIVPSMQGVYVHTDEPATITLDYSKHVWQGTSGNAPMRAPQKQDPNFRRIRIQASSENSGADRMYIIQESSTTRGYDNGYDGKNINASGQVNIYTNEPFGKMEVSCANDIDSMYIGFRAGSDREYRLTFSSLIGGSIYIKDLEDNSITRMNEGGEYHFQATPNSVNHSRFQILLHPSEITDENTAVEDNHVSKINIWIDNKYLHITDAPANSPATIYAISGQRITSYIVNTSHYTIPLSSLSNGIYILQIGDQRYKFVCK